MSRRSLLLALSILALLGGGSAIALAILVRHEPDAYRKVSIPAGPVRSQLSQKFYEEFCGLLSALQPGYEREWEARFTEEQINSYLEEGFVQSGLDERLLPENISQPRIMFEPEKVRLAFRYGKDPWSSIISIEFKVWLTKEPNVIALELQTLKAGSLPINAQSLLYKVSEAARHGDIKMKWYRYNGNPVALLRFDYEGVRPSVVLQKLEVEQGSLVIHGRPTDNPIRTSALLPMDLLEPVE
jgi:hypothetical protein